MECEKNKLHEKIMSLKFAINDISLYLDTHPNDYKKIEIHNKYVYEVDELIKIYQAKYGPLNMFYDNKSNYWEWKESPWPWERGCK